MYEIIDQNIMKLIEYLELSQSDQQLVLVILNITQYFVLHLMLE